MSRYRKVEVRVWLDEDFRSMSPNGRMLWLYFLTGPATIAIPGVVIGREAGLADDLGWSVSTFREAFGEASAKGLVKADWKAGLVVVRKALIDGSGGPRESNRPESPNVLRSWAKSWDDVPECELKTSLLRTLGTFAEALGEGFAKAYREAFAKALAKASRHPSPNQEQEQEQEYRESSEHDSLVLIPDLAEPVRRPDRAAELATACCAEINRLTGRSTEAGFHPETKSTVRLAQALAKAGRTAEQVISVVRAKHAEWGSSSTMARRVCPSTLLAADNFDKYLEELRAGPPRMTLVPSSSGPMEEIVLQRSGPIIMILNGKKHRAEGDRYVPIEDDTDDSDQDDDEEQAS